MLFLGLVCRGLRVGTWLGICLMGLGLPCWRKRRRELAEDQGRSMHN